MKKLNSTLLLAGTWLSRIALGSLCSPVSFKLHAEAENVNPPTNGTVFVGGSFNINGIFCSPRGPNPRGVLEILVHGLTYNKSYWDGFGTAKTYDWPLFATSRGYHTLAIDRLGHGESTEHLDGVEGLQLPLHLELIHQLISSVRHGPNPLGRNFGTIVYVGHSYGSVLATAHVGKYPNDVDVLVPTGHSTVPYPPTLITLTGDLGAARVFPRFAALPPSYLVIRDESAREAGFYMGSYDPQLAQLDFSRSDTMTPGELIVQSAGLSPVPGFKGPVLVVTGAEDAILCNPKTGRSCDDILNETAKLYPGSRLYNFYAVPKTGHDIVLHSTAPETFARVHDWLDDVSI
ncbi:alpha/beta-hydrolase [Thozetella sp. PMI_491]|nr:alpha/beta-hydrolase [Thozetella sp. PMI_491]